MSDLTINGMALGVREDSVEVSQEPQGESGRAVDGSAWSAVRVTKRVWKFSTTPIAKTTAEAWAAWLNGGLLHWTFETENLYSTDGLPIATNPSTKATRDGTHEQYGTYGLKVADGGAPTWVTRLGSTWSIRVWRWFDTSNRHWVINSDGTAYKNGSSDSPPSWISMSSGTLTVTASGADEYIDDLVLAPFVVPQAWVDAAAGPWSYSGAATYPSIPPLLTAAGDMMPSGGVSVIARVERAKPMQFGGTHYQELDVELREV